MTESKNLDAVVSSVVSTLVFYGVEISKMEMPNKSGKEASPTFDILVSKKGRKKSLSDTLDIAYWILWTLIYGEHTEESKEVINLNYKEVE